MRLRILPIVLIAALLTGALLLADAAHASETVTLTAAGDAIQSDIINAFMREHPGIRIVESDVYDSATLIQDAMSRSDSPDIYFMYTLISSTYESLRDRGYFLTLDDPELQDMASAIYPELREAATYNGALCALPFGIQIQPTLAVDMESWTSLGFREDALPSTWAEALRFAADHWPEISAEHEEIGLFSYNDARSFLRLIEDNYEAYRAQHNYEVGYDVPEFYEILELFEHLRTMDAIPLEDSGDGKERFLFWNDYFPSALDSSDNIRSLRLKFREDAEPCLQVGFFVMAVNPNTKHASEAIELMKYVFESLDPLRKLELCPMENKPIVNENYEAQQDAYAERMSAYEARLAAAVDAAERRAIEMERDDYVSQNLLSMDPKYIASPESIQRYRKEVEGILVPTYTTGLSMEEYGAINEKREAFLLGQLSAGQYIRELERRFVFSAKEGK